MIDAISRTLFRLFVSRRNLLQWVTAARRTSAPELDLYSAYRRMAGGVAIAIIAAALIGFLRPDAWILAAPFVILWIASPAIAVWISLSPSVAGHLAVTDADARALRLIARRTWRYFETFVTADDHMLPPDNFQEDPQPVLAHRTSPTNMGLYLLSAVSARDFGWAGTIDTVDRLEAALATMSGPAAVSRPFLTTGTTPGICALWILDMSPPWIAATLRRISLHSRTRAANGSGFAGARPFGMHRHRRHPAPRARSP